MSGANQPVTSRESESGSTKLTSSNEPDESAAASGCESASKRLKTEHHNSQTLSRNNNNHTTQSAGNGSDITTQTVSVRERINSVPESGIVIEKKEQPLCESAIACRLRPERLVFESCLFLSDSAGADSLFSQIPLIREQKIHKKQPAADERLNNNIHTSLRYLFPCSFVSVASPFSLTDPLLLPLLSPA
jgi:hypothetical protein